MPFDDPIVAEIRAIRESRAARFHFNIDAIVKDAQKRDAVGDRPVVRLVPRVPQMATPRQPKTR